MTATKRSSAKAPDLQRPDYYFNRELSWLEFNRRVLHEALDPRTPLLERLKFLAIYTSNLDEFFMVRVAGLYDQVRAGVDRFTPDGHSPEQQLDEIAEQLRPVVAEQHRHFDRVLRPALADAGVYLLEYMDLNQEQRAYLQEFFEREVFPVLTPLAVDPSHPFPFISNLSLNLAVVIKDSETGEEHFARVKVPANVLPRFVPLPLDQFEPPTWALGQSAADGDREVPPTVWAGVPLEQVVAHNLDNLFAGMNIQECHAFRVTRDADFAVSEDEADDLMLAIEEGLRERRLGGSVVRLEVLSTMPDAVRDRLAHDLNLRDRDVYVLDGRLLGLKDLFSFLGLPLPELKDEPWTPTVPRRFQKLGRPNAAADSEEGNDIFAEIRKGDLLVHHPYHSFSATVQRFITDAAQDPNVMAIKMTLYRTSGDSPIVRALIDAAENGKQVAALVELKARFDEENNINWARTLESSGVHVVYGLVGLKTHTKVVLVVRREEDRIRRYVHVGTGNYNPKTAKLYTDLGLLSCREDLGADLTDLFNFLTGYSRQRSYRKMLVAPVNMRDRMESMVRREIERARDGRQGRIVAKMNSLVDPPLIRALYEASQAGVQIDLIVRGICCLRPGVEGVSENIRVLSIIGKFLEHARIFYFQNGGDEEVYIGSADWMPRNLNRRVEAIAPVEDPDLRKDLQEILGVMLADNRQAWDLQPDGSYVQRQPDRDGKAQGSQQAFADMALKE